MKKTLDYLYIFSKLSTSFILLFLLFILGYFFYVSFKNQEISNNDQLELINKLNQNVQKLSKLSEKIEITESSLDEIKISIQNIANSISNTLSGKSAFTNNNATLEEMSFGQQIVYFFFFFFIIYFVMFIGSVIFNDSVAKIFPGVKKVNTTDFLGLYIVLHMLFC